MISTTARAEQLQAYFTTPENRNRPLITSLNGDGSWLFSFPRPTTEQTSYGKVYYHVVFEPWLNGPTYELTSWGIHIALPEVAAVTSAEEVESIIAQIETAARGGHAANDRISTNKDGDGSVIDAILIGFHYLDHLHEPTLRLFDKRIPVVASKEAAAKLKQMGHFDTIKVISDFTPESRSWKDLHSGALPSWLTSVRLTGHHELNYVLTLTWTHRDSNGKEVHETIFQSPHGTRHQLDQAPPSLKPFLDSEPRTEKLALFHGLKESFAMGMKNTYGAEAGLALYRRVGGTKYWIPSHDAPLKYGGIIMRMLWVHDTPRTLEWALENESGEGGDKPNLLTVENGGIAVLN